MPVSSQNVFNIANEKRKHAFKWNPVDSPSVAIFQHPVHTYHQWYEQTPTYVLPG